MPESGSGEAPTGDGADLSQQAATPSIKLVSAEWVCQTLGRDDNDVVVLQTNFDHTVPNPYGLNSPASPSEQGEQEPEAAFADVKLDPLSANPINPDVESDANLQVPGALQVHPSYFEHGRDFSKYYPVYSCVEDSNLLPDPELLQAVLDLGITATTKVIVVGNVQSSTTGAGQQFGHSISVMPACRVAWSLLYGGVKQVAILDGGIEAWRTHLTHAVQVEGSSQVAQVAEVVDKMIDKITQVQAERWKKRLEKGRPSIFSEIARSPVTESRFLAKTTMVEDAVNANVEENEESPKACILVDVRRLREHDGSEEHSYPFFDNRGTIPTAKFHGDWDLLVDHDTGKLQPISELKRLWEEMGILNENDSNDSNRHATFIPFCGTGWRSTIFFVLAQQMGLDVRNYDGSWYEYSEKQKRKQDAAY